MQYGIAKWLCSQEICILLLIENICLKPTDKRLRTDICAIIGQYVNSIILYPGELKINNSYKLFTHWLNITDAELVLFGSSANEFGSPSSDIDISMKLPGNFEVKYKCCNC